MNWLSSIGSFDVMTFSTQKVKSVIETTRVLRMSALQGSEDQELSVLNKVKVSSPYLFKK